MNDLYGTETVPKRFDTTQWLRPGFRGAGLVEPERMGFWKGGLLKFLYQGKPGLQHGAHYNRLMKQYKSQGMDLFKSSEKAMAEASEITRNKKIKIVQDQMNKTNIHDDEYVVLIDEHIRLNDYEFYKDIKRWDQTRPSLADKQRALFFPDWAEARYGDDYLTVLERGQTREIQQSIDPNFKEPLSPADQMVSDIDDMNKANIDEIFEGRKKNAYGGRIGFQDGKSAHLDTLGRKKLKHLF